MVIRTFRHLALCLLFTAFSAWAADVTGKWKATVQLPEGNMDIEFNFKQEGDKLTGWVASAQGDRDIADGKVDGDKVSFAVERSSGKVQLAGTVTGDDLKLVADAGDRKLDIVAKRAK